MSEVKRHKKKVEATLAAVVAHPVRARAFMLLAERTASPNEIAFCLGVELNDVAYHVRKLKKLKLIEEVDSRPVRGAVEHFYRAIERPMVSAEEQAQMSPAERNPFAQEVCQLVFADIASAINSQIFSSRPDNQFVRFPMLLDDQGFADVSDIYDEAFEKALEVQAESAGRLAAGDEDGIHAEAVHFLFERQMAKRNPEPGHRARSGDRVPT